MNLTLNIGLGLGVEMAPDILKEHLLPFDCHLSTCDGRMDGLDALITSDRVSAAFDWVMLPSGDRLIFYSGDERFLRLRTLFSYPVQFVSAGCGRADVISVAGREALRQCDLCLYDALVDDALLRELSGDAEVIYVGKRRGEHAMQQAAITQKLADAARDGLRVVRLKGGDAGIFGRLAEEVELLNTLQLPFRVHPGVSSLSAASTVSGLLLTRRGVSNGFNAYSAASVSEYDEHSHTEVVFMGSRRIQDVCEQMLTDGRPALTPVCLALSAGMVGEEFLFGTLEHPPVLPDETRPGLLLIGKAADPKYRYDEHGALRRARVWITGSPVMQQRAAQEIQRYGGVPVSQPLIELVPLDDPLPNPADYDWIIVSAPYSVKRLVDQVDDVRLLPKLMVCGAATEQTLGKYHLQFDARPHHGFSDRGVAKSMQELAPPEARILRLRSEAAGAGMAEQLKTYFETVEDHVLFCSREIKYPVPPECDAILIASDSAADALIAQCGIDWVAHRTCVAVGKRDVAALKKRGIPMVIAPEEATVAAAVRTLARDLVRREVVI